MGNIYFVQGVPGYVKIGYAQDVDKRLMALQTACPAKLTLLATIPGTKSVETMFHTALSEYRTYGEWFLYYPLKIMIKRIQRGARPLTFLGIQELIERSRVAKRGKREKVFPDAATSCRTQERIRDLANIVREQKVEIKHLTAALEVANLLPRLK